MSDYSDGDTDFEGFEGDSSEGEDYAMYCVDHDDQPSASEMLGSPDFDGGYDD
jgi:hypothetical protein